MKNTLIPIMVLSFFFSHVFAQEQQEYSVSITKDNPGIYVIDTFNHHVVRAGMTKYLDTSTEPVIQMIGDKNAFSADDYRIWVTKKTDKFTVKIFDLNYALSYMRMTFHNKVTDGTANVAFVSGNDTICAIGTDTATLVFDFRKSPKREFTFTDAQNELTCYAYIDTITYYYVNNPYKGQDSINWVIENDEWRINDYHSGTEPGCFPQENITAVDNAWQSIVAASKDSVMPDTEKLRLFRAYRQGLNKLKESQVKVEIPTGYYYIVNKGNNNETDSEIGANTPLALMTDSLEYVIIRYKKNRYHSFHDRLCLSKVCMVCFGRGRFYNIVSHSIEKICFSVF